MYEKKVVISNFYLGAPSELLGPHFLQRCIKQRTKSEKNN